MTVRSRCIGVILYIFVWAMSLTASHVHAQIPTVVSTNLCADSLAMSLTAPNQLLSVSFKSHDPHRSLMLEEALQYPSNTGTAEEIIKLKPKIVLASRRWRNHPQKMQFERLGIKIVVVPLAVSWNDIVDTTRWVGEQIHRKEAAEIIIAKLEERLQRLKLRERPLSVLYLRPNGGTAGDRTHIDTVLNAVGVKNHAALNGLSGWGRYSLEDLIMSPPDAFLMSRFIRDTAFAKSQLSRHPVLQNMMADKIQFTMSTKHWSCSTWHLIHAAEDLASQMDKLPALIRWSGDT